MLIIDPLSGQVKEDIEDTGWEGYLVRRELFDRELAKLALMAGVKLFLNVKVNELIKEDGRVVGVMFILLPFQVFRRRSLRIS